MKEYFRQFVINGAYKATLPPLKWIARHYTTIGERTQVDLLKKYQIELLLDVGANYGQYAKGLLKAGFRGIIESFEPLDQPFQHLEEVNRHYTNWNSRKLALGNSTSVTEINVAGNSASSSLLEMNESHLRAAPESAYIGRQKIQIEKLDNIFHLFYPNYQRIFLKIDTQGFEKAVLEGASASLENIIGLQLEMSFVELYNGETTFIELFRLVEDYGFKLCHIEEGLRHQSTGQLLQADAIFYKPGYCS